MTCPICIFQRNPKVKLHRGMVCDTHAVDFFSFGDAPTKSASQLIAEYGVPIDHELYEYIRDACTRRDMAADLIKDLFVRGLL